MERESAGQQWGPAGGEFPAVSNDLHNGILVADIETKRVLSANPAMCQMLHYSVEELRSLSVPQLCPPSAPPQAVEPLWALIEGRLEWAAACPLVTRQGQIRCFNVAGRMVLHEGRPCVVGFFHDITRQEQAAKAMRDWEAHYRALFTHGLDAILLTYVDGRIRAANPAACAMFGMSEEEICQAGRAGIVASDDPRLADLLRERERLHALRGELTFIRKDKSRFLGETTSRVLDAEGRSFVIIRDISQQRAAETALKDSEERLRRLIETSSAMIWTFDAHGIPREDSPSWRAFTGFELEQWLHHGQWLEAFHPEDRERVSCIWKSPRRPPTSYDIEARVRHHSGNYRPVACRVAPLLNADGSVRMWVGMSSDISDRKRAEQNLQWELAVNTAQAELSEVLIASSAPLDRVVGVVLDYARRLTRSEHGFVSVLDPHTGDNVSQTLTAMMVSQGQAPVESFALQRASDGHYPGLWGHALNLRKGFYTNAPAEHPASVGPPPGHIPIRTFLSVPAIAGGEVVGQIALANSDTPYTDRDLSAVARLATLYALYLHRLRAEEAIRQSKLEAEAANRAKSEFLANMSHEIRTPMTAVLGFADLLLHTDCSPDEQRQYLAIIHQSGNNLLHLIQDVLDLSKIEAGKLAAEMTDCSLQPLVEEAATLFRLAAEAKGLALHLRYSPPLPAIIRTDPARLRQILVNLLSNAIKFTSRGSVSIDVSFRESRRLELAISDTGVGIRAEDQPKLFQPFGQLDPQSGGTGLGLAISRRLAEILGGHITLTSRPGKGSTFTLLLDPGDIAQETLDDGRPCLPQGECKPPERPRLTGRVLVVDDNRTSRQLMQLLLTRAGLAVDLAADGEEACRQTLIAAAQGEPYGLILLDMQMPRLNGYDTARRMREAGWQKPIIAVTAQAMAGDRERCLAAGCDDYLCSPVARGKLLELVTRYLSP